MRRGRGREKYRGKRGEGGRGRSIGGNEGEIKEKRRIGKEKKGW